MDGLIEIPFLEKPPYRIERTSLPTEGAMTEPHTRATVLSSANDR